MLTSKVTTRGQITIPAELRERLQIETGDLVLCELEGNAIRISKVLAPRRKEDAGYDSAAARLLKSIGSKRMSFKSNPRSVRREELHERR